MMADLTGVKAILFDTFGSVVDWRSSLIADLSAWGGARHPAADWTGLVDAWRGAYAPSMDEVRHGQRPWTMLDDLHRDSLLALAGHFGLPALTAEEVEHMVRGWHRLDPWPDSVAGLTRLRTRFVIAPLSNANVALLVNMAKRAGLPWDMVFACELFRHYKPDPETYLGAARLLGLRPDEVMMAAAHNHDLHAARSCGLRTCFSARPTEYGPRQARDFVADSEWDVIADDIGGLATRMGC